MIPKILHYCWIGDKPSKENHVETWLEHCPGFELKIWDNETSKPYFDQIIAELGWDSIKDYPLTYISDMIRLLAIRDYGGWWLDHDVEIVQDLSPLAEGKRLLFTFQYLRQHVNDPGEDHYKHGDTIREIVSAGWATLHEKRTVRKYHSNTVQNSTFAAEPNSEFIKETIRRMWANHHKPPHEKYAMSDWGNGGAIFNEQLREIGLPIHTCERIDQDGLVIYEAELLHPLNITDCVLDPELHQSTIKRIKETKCGYAIHHHVAAGFEEFMEYKHQTFGDLYNKRFELPVHFVSKD